MKNITKPFYLALIAILCTWNLNAQEVYNITISANPPQGGVVIPSGTCHFMSGVTAAFNATPNVQWKLINWTEDGVEVSTEAVYNFVVERDRNLVANFVPATHTITVSANPAEGGTVSGGGSYTFGSVVVVTAIPEPNYDFFGWKNENGELFSLNSEYVFLVTKDQILIAQFGVAESFEVTVSANPSDHGTVSGGGVYTKGTAVTVTAEPNPGFLFLNWTENGTIVSTASLYSFTVSGPRNLVAHFVPATVVIKLSQNIEEGGTVQGAGIYPYGQTVIIAAIENSPEYSFSNWTENGNVVSWPCVFVIDATQHRHLVANFNPTCQICSIKSLNLLKISFG